MMVMRVGQQTRVQVKCRETKSKMPKYATGRYIRENLLKPHKSKTQITETKVKSDVDMDHEWRRGRPIFMQ